MLFLRLRIQPSSPPPSHANNHLFRQPSSSPPPLSSAMIQSHGEWEAFRATVGWCATWEKGVAVLKATAVDLNGRII